MTRNGKIARLPRHIRDELNRRLDNGQPGVRLVEWLNSLPEVQEVIRSEFEARPINEVNLTDWKNGGYLDWQSQQEGLALMHELKSNNQEFAKVPPAELIEPLTTAVMAHYAAALCRSNTDAAEEPRARVKRLGRTLRDLDRLRCRAQAGERILIQRQWLDLEQKIENRRSTIHAPEAPENPEEPKISEQEKQQRFKEWLYPPDLFPERYRDGKYIDNASGNSAQESQSTGQPSPPPPSGPTS